MEMGRRVMGDFMKFLLSVGENFKRVERALLEGHAFFCLSAPINFLIKTPTKVSLL